MSSKQFLALPSDLEKGSEERILSLIHKQSFLFDVYDSYVEIMLPGKCTEHLLYHGALGEVHSLLIHTRYSSS